VAVADGRVAAGIVVCCASVSSGRPSKIPGLLKINVQMSGLKPSNSATRETVAALAAGPVHWAETATAPTSAATTDLVMRPMAASRYVYRLKRCN
jgi:hypothetical protein